MGKKKTDTTKNAAPSKRTIKPAAKKKATAETVTTGETKPLPRKHTGNGTKPKAATAKPVLSQEDIARRAYFLAEKRKAFGILGDPHSDWLEAEHQILAESSRFKV